MVPCQWRNSYGFRVGKPAGTRVEGAPAGCPFTLVFQLRLPFQEDAHFQNLIVWLRNSHNDAVHKLMKSELLATPGALTWKSGMGMSDGQDPFSHLSRRSLDPHLQHDFVLSTPIWTKISNFDSYKISLSKN